MRLTLNIVGVVLVVFGGIWFLQGINVLPGSFMTGHVVEPRAASAAGKRSPLVLVIEHVDAHRSEAGGDRFGFLPSLPCKEIATS